MVLAGRIETGTLAEVALERAAPHQLHRKVVLPGVGLARLVDRGNARVLEASERIHLTLEQPNPTTVERRLGLDQFESNPALRVLLLRLVDHTHATDTEAIDDAVTPDPLGHPSAGVPDRGLDPGDLVVAVAERGV